MQRLLSPGATDNLENSSYMIAAISNGHAALTGLGKVSFGARASLFFNVTSAPFPSS